MGSSKVEGSGLRTDGAGLELAGKWGRRGVEAVGGKSMGRGRGKDRGRLRFSPPPTPSLPRLLSSPSFPPSSPASITTLHPPQPNKQRLSSRVSGS